MISELAFPAFLAGALMFFAPCTFPLIPAYLGLISGVSTQDLNSPEHKRRARYALALNASLFILGFSAIFILFGTAAGWGGQFLFPFRNELQYVAGAFIMLFGIHLLGLFRLPVFRTSGQLPIKIPGVPWRSANSFLVGAAFGIGWTPCVGPILGSVLLVATTSATALSGALLLGIFSLGLAIPFLFVAFLTGTATQLLNRLTKAGRILEMFGGAMLLMLGYLVFTQQFSELVGFGFRLFEFIGYENLLDHL